MWDWGKREKFEGINLPHQNEVKNVEIDIESNLFTTTNSRLSLDRDGGRERYYEGGRGGVERGGPRDDYRGRFYKDAGHDTEGKKIEVLEENDHQEVVDRRWEKSGRKEC